MAENATAQILKKLGDMEARQTALEDTLKTAAARRNTGAQSVPVGTPGGDQSPGTGAPTSAPFARRGENIMSSRGFSYAKAMLMAAGKGDAEHSKIELDLCQRLTHAMYKGGWQPSGAGSLLIPAFPDFFPEDVIDNKFFWEMKSLIGEGVAGADPETVWHLAKQFGMKSAVSPALSWQDQSVGGAFVPPPMWGSPIELLRNKEALLNAGATQIPLGPSGRIVFPRLTSATTASTSAENTQQTPTQPGTGQLELSAKKVISVVALPGELLRFGSPAVEMLIRNDMFKSVALKMDKMFLEGQGSTTESLGLATMGAAGTYGIAVITPDAANQLSPQNFYDFSAAIEENNGEPTGWIMRPRYAAAIFKSRASGDGTHFSNNFLFNWDRSQGLKRVRDLDGMPITATAQVSTTRGSGAQTYVLCGDWPDYLVAMFGAIEFMSTDQGWTLLSSDQVAVRALIQCDGGPRHTGVFAFCDALNYTVQ